MSWNTSIYVGHVAIEGLATANGIQGNVAKALLDILHHHNIPHVFKWVDNIVIFRSLVQSITSTGSVPPFIYTFDLESGFELMMPLGVPWNPIECKGQDFAWSFKNVGFLWDLKNRCVSLPERKHTKIIAKIDSILSSPNLSIM